MWAGVILTALLLQTTVFAQVKLLGAKPELMYLITVVLAMQEGPSSGAIGGFAAGMGQDFLLNQPKGITALVLTLVGYAVGLVRQYVVTPSPMLPVLLVGGATFVGVIFYGFTAFLLGQLSGGLLFLLRVALVSALYNALLTPLLFPLVRRVVEASQTRKVFR